MDLFKRRPPNEATQWEEEKKKKKKKKKKKTPNWHIEQSIEIVDDIANHFSEWSGAFEE